MFYKEPEDILPREEPLTISEFTAQIKSLVESKFPGVWLRGEISNLRLQSNGHAYFTLKDAGSQISAVIFRGALSQSKVQLREGMQLVVFGGIGVYTPRGNYQIVVKILQEEGLGKLQAEFEKLRKRLSAEGLFDKSRKRALPPVPKTIAFVTSPTGAAIRDFVSILRRRNWAGTLYVVPAKVQGIGAAEEIAAQINTAGKINGIELLVVGRGGGSLEDLWCFNEECVARAVAGSRIPVISAVGHEIDFTLSDFASDLRAETPSAAAEYISSARMEMEERTENAASALEEITENAIQDATQEIDLLESRLQNRSPEAYIRVTGEKISNLGHRLAAAIFPAISSARERLSKAEFRLEKQHPSQRLKIAEMHINQLAARLAASGMDSTLKRGFAVATDEVSGKIIDSSKNISLGQQVVLRFHDGKTRVEGRDLAS